MSQLLDQLLTNEQRRDIASRSPGYDREAAIAKQRAWLASLPKLSAEQRAEIMADKYRAVLDDIRVQEAVERDNERARRETGLDA